MLTLSSAGVAGEPDWAAPADCSISEQANNARSACFSRGAMPAFLTSGVNGARQPDALSGTVAGPGYAAWCWTRAIRASATSQFTSPVSSIRVEGLFRPGPAAQASASRPMSGERIIDPFEAPSSALRRRGTLPAGPQMGMGFPAAPLVPERRLVHKECVQTQALAHLGPSPLP